MASTLAPRMAAKVVFMRGVRATLLATASAAGAGPGAGAGTGDAVAARLDAAVAERCEEALVVR